MLGALVSLTLLCLSLGTLAQQPFEPPKEIPKGKSTKQPSPDKPGPTVEELQGLPGAPDPTNSNVKDPSESYPEGFRLSEDEEERASGETQDSGKGSLPPIELPKGAHRLEFKFLRPLTYSVRGTHRLAIEDREDLKQVYLSTARVHYARIEGERPESIWPIDVSQREDVTRAGGDDNKEDAFLPLMMSVERSVGRYTYPELLAEPERVHQITRGAKLSYLIDPRGEIKDLQAHFPTNPLAKSSLEHFARMLSMSQAIFPDKPVKPGESWTQKILYRDGEGQAQLSEDSTNTFTFERWRSCRKSVCAFITFKQDLRAAGRLLVSEQETRGTSLGGGEGWLLFDYRAGEVVKSFVKITGQGTVEALSKKPSGDVTSDAKARVLVEYEVSSERVDSEDASPLPAGVLAD